MATLATPPRADPPRSGTQETAAAEQTFSAFRSRAFTLLWVNTFLFFMVQGIQRFAFVWLALEISNKSGAAGLLPWAFRSCFSLSLPACSPTE